MYGDALGKTVENVISHGTGEPNVSQFHSLVFLRNNQPTFGELIQARIGLGRNYHNGTSFHLPISQVQETRASKRSSVARLGTKKPFAFGFLPPLFPDGRAFLEDGSHNLVLYRADRLSSNHPRYISWGDAMVTERPTSGTTHRPCRTPTNSPYDTRRTRNPVNPYARHGTHRIRSCQIYSTGPTSMRRRQRIPRGRTCQDSTFVGELEIVEVFARHFLTPYLLSSRLRSIKRATWIILYSMRW